MATTAIAATITVTNLKRRTITMGKITSMKAMITSMKATITNTKVTTMNKKDTKVIITLPKEPKTAPTR